MVGPALAGCVRVAEPVVVDLEIEQGDLVIIGRVAANTSMPDLYELGHVIVEGSELSQAITAANEDSLMVFVVHPEDFMRDGGEISGIDRRELDVRLATEPSLFQQCRTGCISSFEPGEARNTCFSTCNDKPGNCGRCLVPATTSPQIVNDGDSCDMPAFAEGRFFRWKEGGGHEKSDAPQDLVALAEAHKKIRLDWAQSCACSNEASTQTFDNFSIRPISPPESVWNFEQYAENDRGVIAGARDRVAVAFDRVGPPVFTEFEDLEADTRAMVALHNGHFLLASESFIDRTGDGHRFDRFIYQNGALLPPEQVARNLLARPITMKHFGVTANAPLFLFGARAGTAQAEPGIFACNEDPFSCTASPIVSDCRADAHRLFIRDAVLLDNGVGVGISSAGVYLKNRTPVGPDPTASDLWTCHQFPETNYLNTRGETILIEDLQQIAAIDNRVYLCATRRDPPCEPWYPVILTATISADAKMPAWTIVAEGNNYQECRSMLPVRGDDSKMRVLFTNGEYVEVTATGTTSRARIQDLFPPGTPGFTDIRALESKNYLAKVRFNSAYVSDGVTTFEKLLGPTQIHDGGYSSVVPLPQGGFVAFGTPHEITRIRPRAVEEGSPPDAEVSYVADPQQLFKSSDAIRNAVLDTASSNASQTVIIGSGYSYRDNKTYPLVRRFFLDPDASMIMNVEDVTIPDTFMGLAVDGIAETAPDRFVAFTQETRLLNIVRGDAYEVEIDWDSVDTSETETRPARQPDRCPPGNIPRLDAFRDIDGGGGVAWAVGTDGLILRVVGDRAERFMPRVINSAGEYQHARTAELRTVRASCPDRMIAGGTFELAGDDTLRDLRAWKVVPKSAPANECVPHDNIPASSSEEGNALEVREMSDDPDLQCLNFASRALLFQPPRALLPDGEDAMLVMENGLIQPLGLGVRREARLKVPFGVLSTYEDGRGHVLFGGNESRLAVGASVPIPSR